MIALLGSLLGFLTSLVPQWLKLIQDSRDKAHELAILELQMEQMKLGHVQRIEEINTQADISEFTELYKTYNTGVHWVDALNGTVRPVLAYAFFLLYFIVKIAQFYVLSTLPWQTVSTAIMGVWGEEDVGIFAGILCFYFGNRGMSRFGNSSKPPAA